MIPRFRVFRLLPAALLSLLPALAPAFSEDQWRCTVGPDGGWECTEVALDAGPFEPVATAPIVDRSAQRAQRPERPFGQTEEMAELTWMPRQALPQTLRAEVPPWCGGAYQPLQWPEDVLATDPETALVTLAAERGEYVVDEAARLEGAVRISQGPRSVEAELATYDALEEALALEGDVLVQEPGILLRGAAAELDLASGDARIDDARFVLYEGGYRGAAATLARTDGGLSIEEGEFTRCEPGNAGWKVAAGRIEIPEAGGYAIAENARLEIYDVPVLWAPRLTVPVSDERKSGFLFPSVGFSGENGFDASLPYYLNLAPNYDATVTPRLMADRGVLLQAEFRQLTEHMENTLGGALLPKDDNYDGEFSFDEFEELVRNGRLPPGTFEAEQRWLGRFEHRGSWVPGLTTEVDFIAVSDDDYLRDIGTDLYAQTLPEVERTAALRLRRGGLDAMLWAQDIQILQEDVLGSYRRLPQFDLSWHERFGDVPMVFGLDFQYAQFERDDSLAADRDAITGDRVHIVPRFTLPLEWTWGWMEATAAWKYTRYTLAPPPSLDDPLRNAAGAPVIDPATGQFARNPFALEDNPTRILPTGSVDLGLRFERDASIAGTRLLQTLEPRLFYLYTERENQDDLPIFDTADLTFGVEQLFRENRFSGIDRINDANQLTAAVTSRLISRRDGSELLSATAGRIVYFDPPEVTLDGTIDRARERDASGWVSELVLRLGGGYDAKALWVWSNDDRELDQGLVRLRWRGGDPRSLFNVAYRTRGDGIDQADVSFSWPFRPNMALIARYFYDIEREEVLEALAGVQYDDCCWRLRLVGRQFLRPTQGLELADEETGIFVEVVMKGLAGFDSGLGSVLEQGIYGFDRTQDPNALRL
ncbi:MAG: LPS-assembly protein LptD [Pseudomonadales bacterium]|jgi:LPS-assembly protein|nr:LPS-assembly protein LptD [Pseudomonadales bacterium]